VFTRDAQIDVGTYIGVSGPSRSRRRLSGSQFAASFWPFTMSRRSAQGPTDEVGADVLRLLRTLVLLALPELRLEQYAQDELVDVVDSVPAPKRAVMRACRNGEVAGAARVGRRWLASRAAVDAWLLTKRPGVAVAPPESVDDLDELRRSLAAPVRARRRRRAS
jgi:hypothetical protein